jgi:HD-GYP domain-containing protein (c-di-GMP phosphodiesterase class II)
MNATIAAGLEAGVPADMLDEMRRLQEQGRRQSIAVASAFVVLIDLRDRYTGGHSSRVAAHVREIGLRMELDDSEIDTVVTAASLHDVGKIGVSDQVLLKPGRLTDAEFAEIQKHPEYGWMVLRNIEGLEEASLIVLHHHERWDGRGYPGRLSGESIPLGSRIIAVADSYDAMTTDRPYRRGWEPDRALDEILRHAGTQFDARAAAAFLEYMKHARHVAA